METLDCGDHSCDFAKDKSGMRTNGGCRCLKPMSDAQRHKVKQHIKQLELQIEEMKRAPDTGHWSTTALALKAAQKDLEAANRLNQELQKVLKWGLVHIGGWRELIAEWDDVQKSSALGEAMYAALDQIDVWRGDVKAVLTPTEKRVDLPSTNGQLGEAVIRGDIRKETV